MEHLKGTTQETFFEDIPGWFRCGITCNDFGVTRITLEPLHEPQLFEDANDPEGERRIQPEDERHWLILQQIISYLRGACPKFNIKIGVLIYGTQKDVFTVVQNIPYGQTITYEELSLSMAKPIKSSQIQDLLTRNPWPLIIPCHRVIKKLGDIGPYVSKPAIKRLLLQMEKRYAGKL